jgi:hypothetical protein
MEEALSADTRTQRCPLPVSEFGMKRFGREAAVTVGAQVSEVRADKPVIILEAASVPRYR